MQITNIHEAKPGSRSSLSGCKRVKRLSSVKREYRLRSSFATMKATNLAGRGSGAER